MLIAEVLSGHAPFAAYRMRKATAKIPARTRFERGPAAATIESAWRPRRLYGFTGVGFAQPNPNGEPPMALSITLTISRVPPTGSKCLNGSRLTRPNNLAVPSPSFQATNAWAHSWTGPLMSRNMTIQMTAAARWAEVNGTLASQPCPRDGRRD